MNKNTLNKNKLKIYEPLNYLMIYLFDITIYSYHFLLKQLI